MRAVGDRTKCQQNESLDELSNMMPSIKVQGWRSANGDTLMRKSQGPAVRGFHGFPIASFLCLPGSRRCLGPQGRASAVARIGR